MSAITDRLTWVKALIDAETSQKGSTQRLVPLWNTVDSLQSSLQRGLDAFGHSASWVPPLRFDYYASLLDGAIAALTQAEGDEVTNRAKAVSLMQQQADLSSLATNAMVEVGKLNDDASQANQALLLLTDAIADQDQQVTDARKTLDDAVATWSTNVQNALKSASGLTAQEFFDAISQIAFLGDDPVGSSLGTVKTLALLGSSAGKVASGLTEEPTITDNNGQPVPIRYELNSLHTFGESLAELKNGMQSLPGGVLQPNVTSDMLIGPEQALDSLFDTFSNQAGSDAEAAKSAMGDYIGAVALRNTTILQFNEALTILRKSQQGIKAAQNLHDLAMNQSVTSSTIGLAELLVDHAVDRARAWCLDVLYRMSRAFMAFALTTDDEFYSSLNLSEAWQFDSHLANDQKTQLVQSWTTKYEQYSANPSPGLGPSGGENLRTRWCPMGIHQGHVPAPVPTPRQHRASDPHAAANASEGANGRFHR